MTLQELYPLIKQSKFVLIEDNKTIEQYDAHKHMFRDIEGITGGNEDTIVIYLAKQI